MSAMTEANTENPSDHALLIPPLQSLPADFPKAKIVNLMEPAGQSNVRSSFKLALDGHALIGTEEKGNMFKTEDKGMTWRKVKDGEESWDIQDVRNFIRAQNNKIYATTTEPAMVIVSDDEGESWSIASGAAATRTVALLQLETGPILVGLRRASAQRTSILRSVDYFKTIKWLPVSAEKPPQNVTCLLPLGGDKVLAGVGYEASGKIYISNDAGQSWEKKAEIDEARDIINFYPIKDRIYALISGVGSLYVSNDEGETWQKERQFYQHGFIGMGVPLAYNGKTYHVYCGTDQSTEMRRHLLLISGDDGQTWYEWLELIQDTSGGASNLALISADTLIIGTGNHSAQGRVFTVRIE
jgi:hypothetical protein